MYNHEKLKEKYVLLAEKRDSTLKSEKIKVKSFEDLRQRYLKLQEATVKLHKVGSDCTRLYDNEHCCQPIYLGIPN